MLQKLILAASLATGVAGSQFPEFSQQYLQRLGGQYDALAQIARDFDASATRANGCQNGACKHAPYSLWGGSGAVRFSDGKSDGGNDKFSQYKQLAA